MDHITLQDKDKVLDGAMAIVKRVVEADGHTLSEEEYRELTSEIMDTAIMAGGDIDDDSIEFYAREYVKHQFLSRFRRARDRFDF